MTGSDYHARKKAEDKGRQAEIASLWLYRLMGWRLVAHRLQTPVCELDLVMQRGSQLLCIEVKYRSQMAPGDNLETALPNAHQMKRLFQAAEGLFIQKSAQSGKLKSVRFDLVLWHGRWRFKRYCRLMTEEGRPI